MRVIVGAHPLQHVLPLVGAGHLNVHVHCQRARAGVVTKGQAALPIGRRRRTLMSGCLYICV
jgi:hypothetical protein